LCGCMRCVWALGPLAAVGVMPWHVPPLYPPFPLFPGFAWGCGGDSALKQVLRLVTEYCGPFGPYVLVITKVCDPFFSHCVMLTVSKAPDPIFRPGCRCHQSIPVEHTRIYHHGRRRAGHHGRGGGPPHWHRQARVFPHYQ
jgi:hypothetical protein